DQIVILGAGFDCRAYRIPGLEQTHVFEVDHPDTQAAKRRCLERMLGPSPAHVTFVAIDFNRQRLAEVLPAAGFEAHRRTFFIWEGVTNYLTEPAVDETLRFIRFTASGSQVLFTYVHRNVLDHAANFKGTGPLNRTLQRLGEQWTFGFDPAELPSYLAS